MSDPTSRLPGRPSLEQLRKRAKDLLRAVRAGVTAAIARFRDTDPRLGAAADSKDAILADAQLVIAREHGFRSWGQLVHHLGGESGPPSGSVLPPLIRPVELRAGRPYTLPDGTVVTTD